MTTEEKQNLLATNAKQDPLQKTVRIRQPNTPNQPSYQAKVVEKRLLNVVANGKTVTVNGVKMESMSALESLFKNANAPVITIATHKCLATAESTKILSIAQKYTQTPIAFKSFGNYQDKQCTG